MTATLARLIGRMPIGWLQLTHSRTKLVAALAGVAFANVLVFVQLGILSSLNDSITASYSLFDADIAISATDANTLTEGSNVPRQYMFRALAVPGVAAATPVYVGNANWLRDTGEEISFNVFGFDPQAIGFVTGKIDQTLRLATTRDVVLIDRTTRGLEEMQLDTLAPDRPLRFELTGRSMTAVGNFSVGGGFAADGTLVASDQTFLGLFPKRSAGAPDHILVKLEPGANMQSVLNGIRTLVPPDLARVRSLENAAADDRRYQTTERPTGLIFGFGVVIGVLVGLVIVYQVLSTDVADHLREYATFKAMGYPHSFFLGIVFEEALILALLGFIPGLLVSWAFYIMLAGATGLPIAMDAGRALTVLLGTIAACSLSGALATRRLANADPADLF